MTFAEDGARAISVIVEQIGTRTGDQYCAGLWMSSLVNQLAWSIHDYESRKQYTEFRSRCQGEEIELIGNAPSWSWLPRSKPVNFHVSGLSFTLPIINARMELIKEEYMFGDGKGRRLIICGQLEDVNTTANVDTGYQFNISKKAPESHILLKHGTVNGSSNSIPDGLAVC